MKSTSNGLPADLECILRKNKKKARDARKPTSVDQLKELEQSVHSSSTGNRYRRRDHWCQHWPTTWSKADVAQKRQGPIVNYAMMPIATLVSPSSILMIMINLPIVNSFDMVTV